MKTITTYGSVSTLYTTSDYKEINHPVTGKLIKGFFVLENGKMFQTVAHQTKEAAEVAAVSTAKIRTARHGK